MVMGRRKRENTAVISVRLPERIVSKLEEVAEKNFRTRNDQVWAILETWLIENGFIGEDDRKRKPLGNSKI